LVPVTLSLAVGRAGRQRRIRGKFPVRVQAAITISSRTGWR
jgi:hypothetical protein